ncbi:hypothetical protein [Pseudomonas cavernae]|nr:hypothetical protein [Pseudomonas cavernae]
MAYDVDDGAYSLHLSCECGHKLRPIQGDQLVLLLNFIHQLVGFLPHVECELPHQFQRRRGFDPKRLAGGEENVAVQMCQAVFGSDRPSTLYG